jgi:hypothetical protein
MRRDFTAQPTDSGAVDTSAEHHPLYFCDEIQEVLRWSGCRPVPAIGAQVNITMNRIGAARVVGYFGEDGFLGILAVALNPPDWLVRQRERMKRPSDTPCTVFGAEIE